MNMSYDSSNLTTPDIKWLGVRPSDLDRFNIPEQCRLPMTEEDMKTGKRLVQSAVNDTVAPTASIYAIIVLCCILLCCLNDCCAMQDMHTPRRLFYNLQPKV